MSVIIVRGDRRAIVLAAEPGLGFSARRGDDARRRRAHHEEDDGAEQRHQARREGLP